MKIDKKKRFFVLLLLFFTVTVFGQTFKYTTTNLHLRNGSSTSHQILTTIPSGTSVEIAEDCDCAWIKIYYDGKSGYVSSKYLTSRQSVNYPNTTNYQSKPNTALKYYTNSAGQKVQSPTYYNSTPSSATALCRDGTYSFSRKRRGTCSHHGGVAKWLR